MSRERSHYGIGIPRTIRAEIVQLSESQLENIRNAHDSMMASLDIEEIFDMNLNNYYDFEKYVLNYNHERCFFSDELDRYWLVRPQISRFVMNFLSSSRSYLDYVPRKLAALSVNSIEALASFDRMRKQMYDERLGYRVLESLRNYTQHRSMPIHNVEIGMAWTGRDRTQNLHSMTPKISVKNLAKDGKFKASVLKELKEEGEHIPFMPFIRSYMDGLGIIHELIRSFTMEANRKDEDCYNFYINFYESNCVSRDIDIEFLLTAAVITEDGHLEEGFNLKAEISKNISYLMSKNRSPRNLSSRFVTSLL